MNNRCTVRYKYNEWRQVDINVQANTPVTTFELTEAGFYLFDVSVELRASGTSLSTERVALMFVQEPSAADPIFMTEVFPPRSLGCRISGYASWWFESSKSFSIRISCTNPRNCTHVLLRITKIL